jgi:hypothetical protein
MFPTSLRIVTRPNVFTFAAFLATILLGIAAPAARAQGGDKKADKPLYVEYKGIRIGMSADDVRKKLGAPKDKSEAEDFFMFSDKETAQVFYDKGKVMAVSVNYRGDGSGGWSRAAYASPRGSKTDTT